MQLDPPESTGPWHVVTAEVTRAIAAVYRDQLGRGPNRARSYFAGHDVLVCILSGTTTPAERYLIQQGQSHRVRETRLVLQSAARHALCDAVERAGARRVVASTSGLDPDADVATEVFVLSPETGS
ncbi:MAG TPA: Na-translocating system protein MpsC family protein [Gaiellales bacterium]|jgi:uncharacterized protein YbcI